MAGYTRQSTYTDGDIIQAADSNDEFDQLLAAFHNATGHKHNGTAGEGPVIGLAVTAPPGIGRRAGPSQRRRSAGWRLTSL